MYLQKKNCQMFREYLGGHGVQLIDRGPVHQTLEPGPGPRHLAAATRQATDMDTRTVLSN